MIYSDFIFTSGDLCSVFFTPAVADSHYVLVEIDVSTVRNAAKIGQYGEILHCEILRF